MNTTILKVVGAALIGMTATSCTTNYDAYGQPRQSVDPLAAAAVAGVAGYAIGKNNGKKNYYNNGPYYGNGYNRPYYGPKPYYGPRPYRRY